MTIEHTMLGHRSLLAKVAVSVSLWLVMAAVASAQGYKAPRTIDGQPDLQGIWQAVNTANWNLQDHSAELGIPAGQGVVDGNEIPYLPTALARRQEYYRRRVTDDPESKCYMVGTPRTLYLPYPFQIVQTRGQINIISEYVHSVRSLRFTGAHPKGAQWFLGDSRARWDGDTLVVDVTNFQDGSWFDRTGNYASDSLHVVERYTRTGPDHLLYEATLEDPKVFARPWKISMPLYRRVERNAQLLEYECQAYLEAERDRRDTR
jgi:hypothetical protein